MLRKLLPRSIYDVMAGIACFGVLAGGTAYAANEWNGSNIQDETLTGADIKGKPGSLFAPAVNGTLTGHDISGQAANSVNHTPFVQGSLAGEDIKDASLTSADVAPGTFVAGRGQLLSNRIVFTPGPNGITKTLLDIPGLAQLRVTCHDTFAPLIAWKNTSGGPVDGWYDGNIPGDGNIAGVFPADHFDALVGKNPSMMLGTGNDPGPRRVASLKAASFQSGPGAPCGFQAQGTLWTSP